MLAAVILAAGKGTRMRSETPKVLHPLLGLPLLEYAFRKADALSRDGESVRRVGVIGWGREAIQEAFAERDVLWAVQEEQLGTGHAAHVGVEALLESVARSGGDPAGGDADVDEEVDILVLNGDLPLLRAETLQRMLLEHREQRAAVTVLTCKKQQPFGFGRILRDDATGALRNIVEEPDCDDATRAVDEVNVGTYLFRGSAFRKYYARIGTDNEQGELYLTDVVVEAAKDGAGVHTVLVGTGSVEDEEETAQVNCQAELSEAAAILRRRRIEELLDSGVRIDDPSTTFIESDVSIEPGARLLPFCVIRRGVRIESECEIGPFAHLRPGADVRAGAKVGNFCEVKNSVLGEGSKTNHLSYVGDAEVGAKVNIGAGTVFANYDGREKHKTVVKDRAFIGSGTILVAPVSVGEAASTGAGSVVLRGRDVGDGEVVVGVPARKLARKPGRSKQEDSTESIP